MNARARGGGQGCLGGVEGLLHRRRPSQGLARTLKCVGQREEKTSSASQKAAVEVHKTKEMLKFEACRRAWKLDDRLHVARERADSGGQKTCCPKNFTSSWPKTDFCGLMVRPFYLAKMLSMSSVVRARNQNIVEVD